MWIDYLVLVIVYLAGSYCLAWFCYEYVFPAIAEKDMTDDE